MLATSNSQDVIKDSIKQVFGHCMNLSTETITDDESFFSLGLTSLIHAEFHKQLCQLYGDLSSTVLFEYPNFELLAEHIFNRIKDTKANQPAASAS
ncbi:acyl carrier protein [Aliikangiella maris]|uniref:Acyl carrier protein n=2 Tax=Aliikangiella maris TaxID=3162458 RepID=A0ABV2BTX1_9GAMM